MFIFVIALVPLTAGFLNGTTRLALILMLLFAFNLSRGISSAAWLPWLTALIPPPIRGKYLSREAGFINLASFLTLLLSAAVLGRGPAHWQFSAIFAFSGLMGVISLGFLKRIPDVEMAGEAKTSNTPVPYREMARFVPFRKLLWSVFGWSLAYGGMTTFTVAFLKTEARMAESAILVVSAVAFLGGFSSLWFLGSRMDRLGSKPILLFSFASWLVIISGWFFLAGKLLSPGLLMVVALEFAMGLAAALINMANTRLAMAIIPPMGRNHFFAIYSVVLNVTLGLSPIFWGLMIDASASLRINQYGFEWNRFSLFFAVVGVAVVGAWGLARRLEEPEAASMEDLLRELLITSPQRVWVRLWPRL
jgi:MFS family permease